MWDLPGIDVGDNLADLDDDTLVDAVEYIAQKKKEEQKDFMPRAGWSLGHFLNIGVVLPIDRSDWQGYLTSCYHGFRIFRCTSHLALTFMICGSLSESEKLGK